jgi:hypothetical protein
MVGKRCGRELSNPQAKGIDSHLGMTALSIFMESSWSLGYGSTLQYTPYRFARHLAVNRRIGKSRSIVYIRFLHIVALGTELRLGIVHNRLGNGEMQQNVAVYKISNSILATTQLRNSLQMR